MSNSNARVRQFDKEMRMRAERQRVGRIASAKGYGRPTQRIESKKVSKRKYSTTVLYCTVLYIQNKTNAYCDGQIYRLSTLNFNNALNSTSSS